MVPIRPAPELALKVMIADDDTATRLFTNTLVCELGYRTVMAKNGKEAIDVYAAEQPDVVLIDRLMPVMDGEQAMAEIRAMAGERWVPIMFVSADNSIETQAGLLAAGADDYLVKPVHMEILRAKLKVAARTVLLNRQVDASSRKLQAYHDANEDEMRVVKHLMARLIQQDKIADPKLEHWILPAAGFSGDLVAAARTPDGVLHVMLADGTGHGLAAALNVLPIVPTFYAMTGKGMDIASIAASLNSTVRAQLPRDRFVAATLVAVDYARRRISMWNGGNPPLLVLNDTGETISRFPARNLALGILEACDFAPEIDAYQYEAPCQLLMCSDGVVEVRFPCAACC